jgi:hypothetical protein
VAKDESAIGRLRIELQFKSPAAEGWKRERNINDDVAVHVRDYACTEADGIVIAEKFRQANPALTDIATITWTGDRKL